MGIKNPVSADGICWLSDQGSNLDFPESKSGVLPVTPSDNVLLAKKGLKTLHIGQAGLNLGLQR
jgi:hypothetical protein